MSPRHAAPRKATRTPMTARRRQGIALGGGLLIASAVVLQSSSAAFTAQTGNAGNSWAAARVAISHAGSGSALFSATGLVPGSTDDKCVVVTYSGDTAADVRLFAAVTSTRPGLEDFLDVTVERGTGNAADCNDFAASETPFATGTLATLADTNSSFATGLGSWTPAAAPAAPAPAPTSTYRISWTVQNDDDAQGKTAEATFTWEAQNR